MSRAFRGTLAGLLAAAASALAGAGTLGLSACGPFNDVSDAAFCPFVLEIFYLGITTGTTPTTYDPSGHVSRLQMAAFLSRSVDGVHSRGSRRALVKKFWTPRSAAVLPVTTVGAGPHLPACDGADVWVANHDGGSVSRVRGSDGRLVETWTGAASAHAALVAMGQVFVTGETAPARLYRLNPSQPAGTVTTLTSFLAGPPLGIAFDGSRIWTSNANGTVSIVTPEATIPWTVTSVGVSSSLVGAVFDGTNVWVADFFEGKLFKLDGNGAVLQTVTLGADVQYPMFDGVNIWVPSFGASNVSVVRASTGAVLATLTGNGLTDAEAAAFDGQRVLVTSFGGETLSLWKAADATPLGSVPVPGAAPFGACSDGINFWVSFLSKNTLARF